MPWVKDYYGILGCTPDADPVVVRAAWKALLTKYHPDLDRSEEAARKLALVNEAWSVLGGRDSRAEYDQALRSPASLGRRRAEAAAVSGRGRFGGVAARLPRRRRPRSGAAVMFGSVAVGTFALAAALAAFYSPGGRSDLADTTWGVLPGKAEAETVRYDLRRLSTLRADLAERQGAAESDRITRAERAARGSCLLLAGSNAVGDARELCPSLGLAASCEGDRGSCRARP